MVWGAITSQGVGELVIVEGKMDADQYIHILNTGLKSTVEKYNLNNSDIIFQQDNDPKHCALKTKKWLGDNSIDVLGWPSNSPGMISSNTFGMILM